MVSLEYLLKNTIFAIDLWICILEDTSLLQIVQWNIVILHAKSITNHFKDKDISKELQTIPIEEFKELLTFCQEAISLQIRRIMFK